MAVIGLFAGTVVGRAVEMGRNAGQDGQGDALSAGADETFGPRPGCKKIGAGTLGKPFFPGLSGRGPGASRFLSQPRRDVRPGSPERQPDPVIEEIEQIRRQLDLDLYEGTIFQSMPTEGQPGAEPRSSGEGHRGTGGFSEAIREVVPTTDRRRGESRMPRQRRPGTGTLPAKGDAEFVATLRLASRLLDRKAADLEDEGRFAQADRLRDLADRLRRECRRIERRRRPPGRVIDKDRRRSASWDRWEYRFSKPEMGTFYGNQ